MCERLNIKSTKDTEKLKAAKDEVYLKGFYEGVMLVGECAGMKVCDAKPIVRQSMMDAGHAFPYWEPESKVMSRSGEECIVALTDQWYLSYGDEEWQKTISDHIHSPNFKGYNDKIMEKFDFVIGWLKEWACCRQFGLGTKLPWDDQFVIESLSDSTIYMAYYTIAHLLQGSDYDNFTGCGDINPDDLTDEVFNYIFLQADYPPGCRIPEARLLEMRQEFEYWYPMDLRVSANDLIPNHLTIGIYCNGHIMVDAEKMSKSKGNFLMMLQCVEEYSADATRFALADAGDTMEDANFDRSVANQAIIYLYNEEEWAKSIVADKVDGKLRTGEMTFMDVSMMNEMNYIIEFTSNKFENMCYRDGLKTCFFDARICRDLYRDWGVRCGVALHEDFVATLRQSVQKLKAAGRDAHVFLASNFEDNKVAVLRFLQNEVNGEGKFPADILSRMKGFLAEDAVLKKDTKGLMQFGSFMKSEAELCGPDALATEMTFDQKAILEENVAYIQNAMELASVTFYNLHEVETPPTGVDRKKMETAIPGKPSFHFT
ncbi:unnamed protein product, partial [Symbiodinium microadriaticum]